MPRTPVAPTLTDGVVTIRAHRTEDVDRVLEQCQDPVSQAWTTVPVPYTRDMAEGFVGGLMPRGWADDTEWGFAMELDGAFGGTVSLRNEGAGRAEVAYGSHPAIRGTGAVERALRLLLAWGFEERGLETVMWRANKGNWPSRRLAWRVGFSFEGTLRRWLPQRGELLDAWAGTLLREDPREPRTPWLANPVLDGEGVRLRPFTEADLPRVVEGLADADTQHWLPFIARDADEADGRAYLEQVTERLASGHTITWAVADLETDLLVGVVGLYRLQESPELGYWTHPAVRGRGIARRASRLAVDHAFETLGLDRLEAYVSAPNAASRGVLEQLGMLPTGVRRGAARTGDGVVVDLAGYDVTASEWGARSSVNATRSTTNPASASPTPTTSGDR